MSKVIFAGCSITSGQGFNQANPYEDYKISPHLWVNLCHQDILELSNLTLVNTAMSGLSNSDIFTAAIESMSLYNDISYLICAWTSTPRYVYHTGFELYKTRDTIGECRNFTHILNNKIIETSYIDNVASQFRNLHHMQFEFVKLIRYINTIYNLANKNNIKVINVNAWCPWDKDFFTFIDSDDIVPYELTEYTQNVILNSHNRDDCEIKKLYQLQHAQYKEYGGIQEHTWANLYNSFEINRVDVNFEGRDPGIKSNYIYYSMIKKFIEGQRNK